MSRRLLKHYFFLAYADYVIFLCWSTGFAGSVLNFPRLSFEPNTLTGIAIVNPSGQDAALTVTAYGADGMPLSGSGIRNPVQLSVRANQQISKLTSELFGTVSPSTVGWFQATSDVDGLTGFFLFLNSSLTFFDGADLPSRATRIVFNHVRIDSGFSTELNIVNPGDSPAALTLQLIGSGSEPGLKSVTLAKKGAARLDAASFFGVSSVAPGAYITMASDTEVAGFEFVRSATGDLLGLNGRSISEQLTTLYFPQMAVLGPWKTEIGLLNYSSTSPAIVTVTAFKGDGTIYGSSNLKNNPVARSLPAGASLREDIETIFGFNGPATLDGWIKVESTTAAINGYVTYGIPAAGSVAAVASATSGQTRAIFSHIATTAGYFTGVAFLNPGSLAANVRVLALRPDGQTLGSYDTVLKPGQRTSKLINELIPAADGQAGGLIWVKSDQPIYLTSLFGTASVLANIPAQAAPEGYKPDGPLPALKLNPLLTTVQPKTTLNFQLQGAMGNVIWKVNDIEGGNTAVGAISPTGVFQAPSRVPSPQSLTITAESASQIAGASVDVVEKTSLVGGLGVVQSVSHLRSLNKLCVAELATIGAAKPILAAPHAQTQNSAIFEVSPTIKSSIAEFLNENIRKIISFSASDGKEYLLAAGTTSGKIFRVDPTKKQSPQVIITGLNQPTAMVIDPQSGNLLVAEADKISIVPKAALEAGLTATKDPTTPEISQRAAVLFSVNGAGGIAVDNCSGKIYVSDSITGRIVEFNRDNGQTRTLVPGLANPGQLLAFYRSGVSCPNSFQLLVVEQTANRISLIIPKDSSTIPWLPAAG